VSRRAAALTLVALVAAGCGGGGDGRLSKEDYAKQADAICSKYNRRIQALGRPKTLADIGPFAEKALALTRKGNAELRGLNPPKAEKRTVNEWLAQNEVVAKAVDAVAGAAKKNDRTGVQAALARGQRANKDANALARELGLRVCARG
jgi:hypothetical protein